MQGLHLKLIFANDPDVFQERLDRFIEGLPDDAMIVDIKYSNTTNGAQILYSALLHYKAIEEW